MRRIELEGTPRTMGESFGEACRAEIAALYRVRRDNAIAQARRYGNPGADEGQLLAICARSWPIVEAFDPRGAEELRGIARGAGLGEDAILALNGLTDYRDALAWGGALEAAGGCTAVLAAADACSDGRVRLAQSWDLGTDNAPYVVAVQRRPAAGPASWSVTTVGCLAIMGINEVGLAVGTTNLRTRDARAGVPYVAILQRALEARCVEDAIPIATAAQRAGAHSYLFADAHELALVEATATRHVVERITHGVRVQTNHCQHPEHARLEGDTPTASSHHRAARMRELSGASALDRERILGFFEDQEGGELAICRDDFDGISTNAAFLAEPAGPAAWACAGLPGRAPFERLC